MARPGGLRCWNEKEQKWESIGAVKERLAKAWFKEEKPNLLYMIARLLRIRP